MTLVELIVVLLVLSLIATMTTIRFAEPLQKQRLMSALQQWQSIDFFARKLGRTSEVLIRLDNLSSGTRITIERDGSTQKNWMINAPMSLAIVDSTGRALENIRFVRSQGSIDYRVHVREGAMHERLEIAGGTGKVRYGR